MRIRFKKWARPELAASPFCMDDAFSLAGKWRAQFAKPEQPFYVELGCGKGGWVSQAAVLHPECNYLALDIKSEMLGVAKRKTEQAFAEAGREPDNIRLSILNIERFSEVLTPADAVDRIYINFCNPWPKEGHKKRRLTHPRQLRQYAAVLRAELHFKTDDRDLFEESLEYFTESGWEILHKTFDLHADEPADNIRTEHENMFTDMGKKINFLIAKPPADAFGKPVPNLHAPETVKLLRSLEKQHGIGILTDEEFERQKQRILNNAQEAEHDEGMELEES
ncbi:MAG: tRNA (guanosine(46)-N7)-methyltransferase TrmB [Oscillospiraceae bacterium]|nr:tRNA (guanosine(46)-N7)-methyltransferase TrmB [Oscillospiraceae bacterium]